jgi:hypothetical protein
VTGYVFENCGVNKIYFIICYINCYEINLKNVIESSSLDFEKINFDINGVYFSNEYLVKYYNVKLQGKYSSTIRSNSDSTKSLFIVERKNLILFDLILEQRLNSRIAHIYESLIIIIVVVVFFTYFLKF